MIQVEQLTKVYGSTTAIDHLDFTIERGEIVGFLGPNGAGKSTTMRILAGALGATEGRAMVGGIDVFREPKKVKRLVGYLPEVPPLYVDMTVRDFLRFCGRVKGAESVRERVDQLIERVGLAPVSHRLIDHLSKGYRQRVGIAQALVHRPQVLILDEPASGLDPAQRVEIRQLVEELAQGDVTVILSTHVLPEVEAICDRVIVIDRGRIVASDRLDALSRAGTRIRLTVARPDEPLMAELNALDGVVSVESLGGGQLRVTADADVREAVARAAVSRGLLELGGTQGLEEVYLQLTGGEA